MVSSSEYHYLIRGLKNLNVIQGHGCGVGVDETVDDLQAVVGIELITIGIALVGHIAVTGKGLAGNTGGQVQPQTLGGKPGNIGAAHIGLNVPLQIRGSVAVDDALDCLQAKTHFAQLTDDAKSNNLVLAVITISTGLISELRHHQRDLIVVAQGLAGDIADLRDLSDGKFIPLSHDHSSLQLQVKFRFYIISYKKLYFKSNLPVSAGNARNHLNLFHNLTKESSDI